MGTILAKDNGGLSVKTIAQPEMPGTSSLTTSPFPGLSLGEDGIAGISDDK